MKKITITSIYLKGPLKFFPLSLKALRIMKQLNATNCLAMKKRGIWTKHYTMTLWENEQQLKDFARSGAHLKAMQEGKDIAKEIRSITMDADTFPSWKEAKELLETAKPVVY